MGAFRTIGLGLTAFVIAVADVPEGVQPWQPWTVLLAAIGAIALASPRRSRPAGAMTMLVGMIGVAVGAEAAGEPGQMPFGMFLLCAVLIADVAFSERRRAVAAVAVLAAFTAAAAEGLADERTLSDVVFVAMLWASAVSAALAGRWRKQAADARDDRVRMLERERIARDLHDVVAHHVSAIALTAEGARGLVGRDDELVARSLGSIHATSATTLDEMRRLVAILRSPDDADAPMRLVDLASTVIDHGSPEVVVTISETIPEPPATVTAAAARIVQEAVTNCRRHAAHATSITVDVHLDRGELLVSIVDDGERSGKSTVTRAGYGLAGMAERAELLGGRCTAGPVQSGGWQVEARLPVGDGRA